MKMQLMHDDQHLEIMDKVNACLKSKGLEFRDDGLEHDGWMDYELVEIPTDPKSRSIGNVSAEERQQWRNAVMADEIGTWVPVKPTEENKPEA